ncbi:MAG: FkbM family methyltransferase [Verrucomicrobiaceae bacterium]|nr:FkbM family methyltransferase [Verrucomicrobiaceae bacterium]
MTAPQFNASKLRRALLCLNKDSRRDFRFFRQFPHNPLRTFLDIGAYHGEFTDRVLRHYPVERVHLFEPFPDSISLLKTRYQNEPRCTVHPFALSDTSGSTALHVLNHADSSSLLDPAADAGAVLHREFREVKQTPIEMRRLDEIPGIADVPHYDLAKIDVQGAELKVLRGFGALLERIQAIYIEVNFTSLYQDGAVFCETHAFLEQGGFKLGFIQEFRRNEVGVMIYANAYYFRTGAR